MTNKTCTILAWDYVLLRALLCNGRCHTWAQLTLFSQWWQIVKSLYFKVLTLSHLMPLTFQFTTSLWACPEYYISLLLTVLDIIYSSSNIAKNPTVYSTLTALCACCFCTVCPVHLVTVRFKMWMERIQLVSMQAVSIASKIKHTVYHQDINYNCLYLLYYTYNKHCNQ